MESFDMKDEHPPILAFGIGVFVVHGGLFRNKRGDVGSISDLQKVSRFIKDPDNDTLLDVLWSDPQSCEGITDNYLRGCATYFGPDITREFLRDHGLHLMIRSHEGPDAREKRPFMKENMMEGYAIDQWDDYTNEPLLITLFSAPDYPQGPMARGNKASYIVFVGADPELKPTIKQFNKSPDRPDYIKPYPSESQDLTDHERDDSDHDSEY
jgi:serine/threonine-protein phosphatase 5